MKNFDFNDFIQKANVAFLKHKGNQRYGQFLMNYLHKHYSDVYELISDDVDPTYDQKLCGSFLIFLSNL